MSGRPGRLPFSIPCGKGFSLVFSAFFFTPLRFCGLSRQRPGSSLSFSPADHPQFPFLIFLHPKTDVSLFSFNHSSVLVSSLYSTQLLLIRLSRLFIFWKRSFFCETMAAAFTLLISVGLGSLSPGFPRSLILAQVIREQIGAPLRFFLSCPAGAASLPTIWMQGDEVFYFFFGIRDA